MWRIKRWGKDKYGLWTTISDGWMHNPKKLTRKELIEIIEKVWRDDFEEKIEELRATFPNDWVEKDTNEILSDDKYMSKLDYQERGI